MAIGQQDAASGDPCAPKTIGQLLRGLLAAAVGIGIEGEINGARTVAQLLKLAALRWVPNEQVTLRKPACHNTA